MKNIRIISASAGSGKTHKLVEILVEELKTKRVRPEAVLATTFTKRAAAELQERVRRSLLKEGLLEEAQGLLNARFGTVHAVCSRLLSEFAFELGFSPDLQILEETLAQQYLKQSLERTRFSSSLQQLEDLKTRWDFLNKQNEFEQDWSVLVLTLLNLVRSNRLDEKALLLSRQQSVAGFVGLLDPASKEPEAWEMSCQATLKVFLQEIQALGLLKGNAVKLVKLATLMLEQLQSGHFPGFSDWLRLEIGEIASKYQSLLLNAQELARDHLRHPLFSKDALAIIDWFFDLAQQGLVGYADFKRQNGLIDFTDQEVFALELLESETIQQRLKGQIDLVLVDEFQDTSPLQLSIFLKLADLAKQSVWVGDQKQAIYGFRGSDPALMESALKALLGKEEPTTLNLSYRSRPGLVRLTSAVFTPAFQAQGIPETRVKLDPSQDDEPPGLGPFLEQWIIDAKNKQVAAQSIAAGVMDLLKPPYLLVRDRGNQQIRPVQPGDIAVLCRVNADCDRIALELEALGQTVSRPRPGLLCTHEGRLMFSGLRLWLDPKDRLAQEELLRLLEYPEDSERWLTTAPFRHESSQGLPNELPEDPPWLWSLWEMRSEYLLAGPLEVFDLVGLALQARERFLAWGNASVRLGNFGALREAVVGYMQGASTVKSAPNLAGLLSYLEQLQKSAEDKKAALSDKSTVQISTWHGAKGLEWPVVIIVGLETMPKTEPFGVTLVEPNGGFNANDPLHGRLIRFWPRPYHARQTEGSFFKRVQSSPEAQQAIKKAHAENLRLLYVTWTRARDRVILVAPASKDSPTSAFTEGYLELLNHEQNRVLAPDTKDDFSGVLKIQWAGMECDLFRRRLSPRESVAFVPKDGFGFAPLEPKSYPPAWITPSASTSSEKRVRSGTPVVIGPRISLSSEAPPQDIGHALHGFLAADQPVFSDQNRMQLAQDLLNRWQVQSFLEPDALVTASLALRSWVDQKWPKASWHREVPLQHRLENGSVVRGTCDIALELEDGFVVIDHKAFSGDLEEALSKIAHYEAQLWAYSNAIKAATNKMVHGCYIHLPLLGVIVEVSPTEI